MQINEILSRLDRTEGRFPHDAVRESIVRREEMTPALLGILEEVSQDPLPFMREDRMAHIFAMYLLAQFRETRAYPLLVRIFSVPGETVHDLAGEIITEDLDRILASVSNGDIGGITSLAEDTRVDEYVRAAAMGGLLALVAWGLRSRDEIMGYFDHLFEIFEPEPPMIWNGLASACARLWPEEVKDKIRRAYEEGCIESGYIGWEDIEDALARGKDASLRSLSEEYRMISDVEEEIGGWACFHQTRATSARHAAQSLQPTPGKAALRPGAATKVGRNDPCPCGSGKKFKKCCGR